MKSAKLKKILFIFIISFTMLGFCYADEDDELANKCLLEDRVRLQELASKIKVTYEPGVLYCVSDENGNNEQCDIVPDFEEKNWDFEKYIIYLKIYNMTDDFVIFVKDGKDKITTLPTDIDEEGIVTIPIYTIDSIRNVQIKIKGRTAPCNGDIKTINYTLPKYNNYARYQPCDIYSDYYLCQEYTTFDISYDYFIKHIDEYSEKKEAEQNNGINLDTNENNNGILSSIGRYKYYIIIAIIAVGILLTIIILRRNKKNENNN